MLSCLNAIVAADPCNKVSGARAHEMALDGVQLSVLCDNYVLAGIGLIAGLYMPRMRTKVVVSVRECHIMVPILIQHYHGVCMPFHAALSSSAKGGGNAWSLRIGSAL